MDIPKNHNMVKRSSSITINPGSTLLGEVNSSNGRGIPGDKSLSHRAALLAALAKGESQVKNFSITGVTEVMLAALNQLKVPWELEDNTLTIQGIGIKPRFVSNSPVSMVSQSPVSIHCGNSATTMRLLSGALAVWRVMAVLDGTTSLRNRPMLRIVEPLQKMDVNIRATDGHAPLFLHPSQLPLRALDYTLPVASAQIKTCLLLAALVADGDTTLIEPGPSRDHTERMMRAMGVSLECSRQPTENLFITRLTPPGSGFLNPLNIELPGDFSAAAFLIVAALITPGSKITINNVGLNPTRTGLLDTLQAMGAKIQILNLVERSGEPVGDLVASHSHLQGVLVGGDTVVRMIDEFPAFAVAAACAEGVSKVTGALELRHKESDRISSLGIELRKVGVLFNEMEDGFSIKGDQPILGGIVNPHGDHRLAMSLSIIGLISQSPVIVRDSEIISESFPEFVSVLQQLGAKVEQGV